jgi:soluble lytic murein transglycosylase-like protein
MFKKILVALTCLAFRIAAQSDSQSAAADRQREQTLAAMATSIDKQKVSLRLQKTPRPDDNRVRPAQKLSDFFVTESLLIPPATGGDCDPLSQLQVQSLSDRAASANGISSDLVRAVMKQESGFRPCALSPVGAIGLMQLMPDTADDLGVADATDPETNVFGGAKLLRKLMDRYAGNLNLTLGAYNAGPANVDRANGVPAFPETLAYVDKIMKTLLPSETGALPTGYSDPGISVKPAAGN